MNKFTLTAVTGCYIALFIFAALIEVFVEVSHSDADDQRRTADR